MILRTRGFLAAFAAAAAIAGAGSPQIIAAFGSSRTISLYNIHSKETVTVLYRKDGKYIASAMEKINWVLRDWRKDEATKMDPALIDLLWEMHSELGSKEPIHIISGFRSRGTNDMLRRTVGGQASQSRHILGKAADVHFPDVPIKKLRYSALIRERGGVGYYPTSAVPFVHVDTDRVRAWPRLPRDELALLFPNGHSHHLPDDGRPTTRQDVRVAQSRHRELAQQIAEFHEFRLSPKQPVLVAEAEQAPRRAADGKGSPLQTAALPKLIAEPRPAARPAPEDRSKMAVLASAPPAPSEADRMQLASLAGMPKLLAGPALASRRNGTTPALTPAALTGPAPKPDPIARLAALDQAPPRQGDRMSDAPAGGWVTAPAYDEDHPEELSYRPFPLGPLLSASITGAASVLDRLQHPDIARTLDTLGQPEARIPLTFRPGQQVGENLMTLEFAGDAVSLERLMTAGPEEGTGARAGRKVRTSAR